jgi:ABC-type uncharacterized transport system involved in gliding motility auxiliary subunit
LLHDLADQGRGKFSFSVSDPNRNPVAAREAGITADGNILLEMGGKREIAAYASETELTRAMIRQISPGDRVYLHAGHLELDVMGRRAFPLPRTLESKNYSVVVLSLISTNEIPEDALAVIVAGARKPVSTQEVRKLGDYLESGGSVVLLSDPSSLTDFGDQPDPLATYLEASWGILLNDDLIVDPTSQNPIVAIAGPDEPHAITDNWRYVAVFPAAHSLETREVGDIQHASLLTTAPQAWGEMGYVGPTDSEPVSFDEGIDRLGPLTTAVASEDPSTGARLVVFGSSSFAADDAFNAYGNSSILANAIDWAAEQDDLINLTPRDSIERTFQPPQTLQSIAILLGSICGLPGLVLAAGVYAWISRRRRG